MKIAVFNTLAQAWESVDKKGASYVFQTREWISCWLDTIGERRGFRPYFTVISNDNDDPLMLLPVGLETGRILKYLVFPDATVTDYNAPIIFPNWPDHFSRADFLTLWNRILAALPPVDLIVFKQMPDKIQGRPNPLMQLPGLSKSNTTYSSCLQGNWDAYFQQKMGAKSRNTIRRKMNKLRQLGELKFETVEDVRLVDAVMDQLIEQKTRRLVETGATNFLKCPAYRAFYQQLAKNHLSSGLAHLSYLKLDETIIAAHLGVIHQGRFYYLVPSFEAGKWERYSPGQLLLIHLLGYCFDHNLPVIDFTLGDEPYKMQWAGPDLNLYDYVHGLSAKGKLFVGLRDQALIIKREFKRLFPTMYYALKRKIT